LSGERRVTALSAWRLSTRIRDRAFALAARRSFAAWGEGTSVRMPFRVKGEHAISLGTGVCVGEGSWFQTLGTGTIEIGDECQFSGYAVLSAAVSIVIEPRVLIARNVHVLDHLHRFDLDEVAVYEQGIVAERSVRIGQGCWIGANAVILPGVTIGRQAVVGANSVVRNDVDDLAVVAGAPARVISKSPAQATLEAAAEGGACSAHCADAPAHRHPGIAARGG